MKFITVEQLSTVTAMYNYSTTPGDLLRFKIIRTPKVSNILAINSSSSFNLWTWFLTPWHLFTFIWNL